MAQLGGVSPSVCRQELSRQTTAQKIETQKNLEWI
jgi:hypothetical protein